MAKQIPKARYAAQMKMSIQGSPLHPGMAGTSYLILFLVTS